MRSEFLRGHQVSNDLKQAAGLIGDIYDELLQRLFVKPCVGERDRDVQELLDSPGTQRK